MPRTGLTASQIREKALAAAVTRMRDVGFAKVRLTDIARDVGVSHAALYMHFRDKSALLDAVSLMWLELLDEELGAICRDASKPPVARIFDWVRAIHRTKLEKVRVDPALYAAFDSASETEKPFVKAHLETMHRQLTGLAAEAADARGIKDFDADSAASVISAATIAFHHPKLVAQMAGEDREQLLDRVVESVLKGLELVER